MSKRTKKINQKCDHFLFCLKPQQNFCKFSHTISVSFCDSSKHRQQKKSTKQKQTDCLECPVFNKDNNFATPTFILHSERVHFDSNQQHFEQQGQKLRTQHEKKMIEYTDQKDSLNLPKPRSKNSFCNVCRQSYDDYLNHVQSDNHKKCIRNSNFNRYILELVDKFNPAQKSSLNFSQNTHSTQDDDDVEILYCRPKKKIKPIEELADRAFYPMMNTQIVPPPHFNIGHGTYFPHGCQNFVPNQGYGFIYPFNNLPTMQINYNHQPMMQNQINYNFQGQGYGFVNPWSKMMEQYQRNLVPFSQINQSNPPVMQQNFNHFGGFFNTQSNYEQTAGQQKPITFQQNGFEQRTFWDEEKKVQVQANHMPSIDQFKNFHYERR